MRLYANCREMHSEVKRDLHEMGITVHPATMQDVNVQGDQRFKTLEISPCTFTLLSGADRDQLIIELRLNLGWCLADFNERVSGLYGQLPTNPGQAWELRHDDWAPFIHQGRFAYTYSERLSLVENGVIGPLRKVMEELTLRPETRQGVVPIFRASDLRFIGGERRVPCSMYYQFLIRPDGLRMIYTMRSSDFITHFPYDIWQALQLQEHVAFRLGLEPGRFTFFTGSLHIYAKDADQGAF